MSTPAAHLARLGVLGVLALAGAPGCATVNGLGTARTLDAGETRLLGGAELGWVSSRPFGSPLLRLDGGVRHGLSDRLEVGAHAGGWPLVVQWGHVGADAKLALVRSPDPTAGFDLSLAAAVQLDAVHGGGATGWGWTAQLPLLVGVNDGPRRTWVVAPRLVYQGLYSEGASPVLKPYGGLSLGVAWRGEEVTVLPQVGLLWSDNPADQLGGMGTLTLGFAVFL